MRVMMADLLPALTLQMVQEGARMYPLYQELKRAVQEGKKPWSPEMVDYTLVWKELSVVEDVCFRERIVIPDGTLPQHKGRLRDRVVDLGTLSTSGRRPHQEAASAATMVPRDGQSSGEGSE